MKPTVRFPLAVSLIGTALFLAGCERPPIATEQRGYRGLGMMTVENPRTVEAILAANQVPAADAPAPAGGPPVTEVYKNVKVLTNLNVAEFTRLMVAMTNWVSPAESCNYCHAGGDFASDAPYAKVVARRMLEMTRRINADWKSHVGETGVTCYTCHRGNPVPANVWFADPSPASGYGFAGNRAGQNAPARSVGLASLPVDPFSPLLKDKGAIRVASTTALPAGNRASIQATELTYGLMMHLSQGLGVNCTYCHNTRSFFDWDASTPQRTTAWHGISMVRDLNTAFLDPLKEAYPKERLGPHGDAPKANCATCHQGVAKPLLGAGMVKDYPELGK